ncbi:MAG: FkbM family methyltransferase [Hyphomicrobiales bacterium]
MTQTSTHISVDWLSGTQQNATVVERLGLLAMSTAARVLARYDGLGMSYVAQLFSILFPSDRTVCLEIDEDLIFCFPYGDKYWSMLLKPGHIYEEEVEDFLLAMRDVDYVFIDCGANFGYWSAKVSSERFGSRPTIAVELDPSNFKRLLANSALNGDRYRCMNLAVFDKDGETLHFYGKKHEARTVERNIGATESLGEVSSATLDHIVATTEAKAHNTIVLKLDIEGVEIKALKGAQSLLEKDVLVIYEDHGNDPNHAVSRYLSEDCGMRLFAQNDNQFFELGNVGELNRLKTNRRKGYDFFATQSHFWLDRIAGLVDDRQSTETLGQSVAQ